MHRVNTIGATVTVLPTSTLLTPFSPVVYLHSALTTGTRRKSCNRAPTANSASATLLQRIADQDWSDFGLRWQKARPHFKDQRMPLQQAHRDRCTGATCAAEVDAFATEVALQPIHIGGHPTWGGKPSGAG